MGLQDHSLPRPYQGQTVIAPSTFWPLHHNRRSSPWPPIMAMAILPLSLNQSTSCHQWTMAHSPAAMIAAITNHAPQLAPLRKSLITLPRHPVAPTLTEQFGFIVRHPQKQFFWPQYAAH